MKELIVGLVRVLYEGWESVNDERFQRDEIEYKIEAMAKAKQRLDEDRLRSLYSSGDYQSIVDSLLELAKATNLLWMPTTKMGDLEFITNCTDLELVSRLYINLLHGDGEFADRIDAFCEAVESAGFKCGWPAASYFSFLLGDCVFVKPSIAKWFMGIVSPDFKWNTTPNGATYRDIEGAYNSLIDELSERGVGTLIDSQSVVFSAYNVAARFTKLYRKRKKGDFFSERIGQIEGGFPAFAKELIEKLLEKPITNEILTGLIQVLKHSEHKNQELGRKYIMDVMGLDESYFERWKTLPTGYTAVGKAGISGLSDQQLEAVRAFLSDISNSDSLDEMMRLCDEFEKMGIPQVKAGIFSPWLHYLKPTKLPILNGAVIDELKSFGYNPNSDGYTRVIEIANTLMKLVEEDDMGYLDAVFYDSEDQIAPPFDRFFANREEADLFFDFLETAFEVIGIESPDDERVAIILYNDKTRFRLTYGQFAMFQIKYRKGTTNVWGFSLFGEYQEFREQRDHNFKSIDELFFYSFPAELVPEISDNIKTAWVDSLRKIESKVFSKAISRRFSNLEIVEAVLDRDKREDLLANGLVEVVLVSENEMSNLEQSDESPIEYYFLKANPAIWSIDDMKEGEINDYSAHSKSGRKRHEYSSYENVKPGDILFGYSTSPDRRIVGLLEITEGLNEDRIEFKMKKILDSPITFEEFSGLDVIKSDRRLLKGQGSLFKISKEQAEVLLQLADRQLPPNPPYSLEDFKAETHLEQEWLEKLIRSINIKKQIILYGPPGTGKTYVAERLARHITAETRGIVELVQFHPSYSYEDFMEGIRPKVKDGAIDYPNEKGRFVRFCDRARRTDAPCVFIIDEINRANLSRVFGELMYLLEYRDKDIILPSGAKFSIPNNVRVIGTMNTADRSIALVDFALRRRFRFISMEPDMEILRNFHAGRDIEWLISAIERLNSAIADSHYAIGTSFFLCKDITEDDIADIWQTEIEPYIEEFFTGRPEQVEEFKWEKIKG